jgi:hypothetical protein
VPSCRARMRVLSLQPVQDAARLAALALLLGGLPGCQVISGSATGANVRIIDASPNAPGLDIYQGSSALAFNLGFGTVTSYVAINPGISTISADTASTKQQLVTARGTFTASTQYTVLVGNIAASLQETVLTDQSQAAPAGEISMRVLDQATNFSTGVDVYLVPSGTPLASVSPILTNVVFGSNSGYLNIPAGTYAIELLPTGTVPTATTMPAYTGKQTAYSAGAARTILILDQQVITNPGLQVVIASDYDSPATVTTS